MTKNPAVVLENHMLDLGIKRLRELEASHDTVGADKLRKELRARRNAMLITMMHSEIKAA